MGATMARTAALPMDPQAPSEDRMPQLICGFFILIGSVFVAWGVSWFLQTALFMGRARPSTGVVVGEHRSTSVSLKGQSNYREVSSMGAPIVEFRDGAGVTHRFRALASTQESFAVGERLPVLYDPLQPGRASIRSFDALWMRPILLMGFGGAMAGMCAWILVMVHRMDHPEASKPRRRR
jgi:hypothetical protein